MKIPLTPLRCLRYAREQFPEKIGVVCGDRRFTYAEFSERAYRLAGALREAGLEPGDRVAFLSGNCHRLLEAYYGVVEAGGVLLPLNIRLTPNELAYILNDAEARFVFLGSRFLGVAEGFRQTCSSVKSFVLLDGESLEGQKQASWLAAANYEKLLADSSPYQSDFMEVDEDSLAEIFYTSGTSADPKGVMLTHRNIYLHALSVGLAHGIACETVELHTIPLFHANGWGIAHSLTLVGGAHVMIPRFETEEVFRLIEQERVHSFSVVPTMATALVNCPQRRKYDLSSLRRITIGGAASSPSLVREVEEKMGCTCFSGYGLTETSPVLTISPMKAGLHWQEEQRHNGQSMTGFAVPGVELRVVDAEMKDVPHDGQTIGEIVARGDGVMEGYWRQPEATEQVFRGGWFHTGDLATIDRDGYLLIADREKDIIISGGENISSLEVEKALAAHANVYEAAVIPVPDATWGEVPKALVVLKPGCKITESELLDFCRSRLAHYKCPRSVVFLDSLPKTGTGKLLKRELRKKYAPASQVVRPGTPTLAHKS